MGTSLIKEFIPIHTATFDSPSPPSPPSPKFSKEWRKIDWSKKARDQKEKDLRHFDLNDPDVGHLRILLLGPIGAGKSSFINSLNNVFQGRITSNALVASHAGKSFTRNYKTFYIKNGDSRLPFVFNDVMGLEPTKEGVDTKDIINAVKGHIPEGYKFFAEDPLQENDPRYIKRPKLSDKAHCLVTLVPAHTFSQIQDAAIKKMMEVREAASKLGIPQVVVLTFPDEACELVNKNLKDIYWSKDIKKKMELCSIELGLPMNCILPVKNYSEEIEPDNDMDVLILSAMSQIVHFANDYLWTLKTAEQ